MFATIQKIVSEALPAPIDFTLETPPDAKFGDLATNAALILAKKIGDKSLPAGRQARELATEIAAKISANELVAKTEIAGPGFINIFLAPQFFHQIFLEIEKAGSSFGRVALGENQKVLLEFISANPTGPLTIANGRGGFGGDVLARVLTRAGFVVSREFYVNDAGNQIVILGNSLRSCSPEIVEQALQSAAKQHIDQDAKDSGYPELSGNEDQRMESARKRAEEMQENIGDQIYKGSYIRELAEKYREKISNDPRETGEAFLQILLEEEIKPSIAKMGIKFDQFFSEKKLHDEKLIEKNLEKFASKIYEQDGAMFLRTTDCGDDKDRVLKKADGAWTYFAADIAYHADKFARADKLIDIWGADHHGYIGRILAAAEVLGRRADLKIIITQLVKLFREGKEVRMSKRAGNFELMDDLIAEVGADAARWFFVMRDWNTHLNFDLGLAKKQSTENPVFYVQYAHTRLASILEKAGEFDFEKAKVELLTDPAEFNLIKKIAELPDLIAEIARDYSVNQLTNFATELAATFHKFYENCRVVDSENPELSAARLRLVATTKEVLRIVLEDLVGVSAPTKM